MGRVSSSSLVLLQLVLRVVFVAMAVVVQIGCEAGCIGTGKGLGH